MIRWSYCGSSYSNSFAVSSLGPLNMSSNPRSAVCQWIMLALQHGRLTFQGRPELGVIVLDELRLENDEDTVSSGRAGCGETGQPEKGQDGGEGEPHDEEVYAALQLLSQCFWRRMTGSR